MKIGKKISCGVILTNGTEYLMCHPTNSLWWNIPKGILDRGESYAEAAVRELEEETGLKATTEDLEYLGMFPYKRDKDLALFKMQIKDMPDESKLTCTSTFRQGSDNIPEMDDFQIVDRDTFLLKVNPSLRKVLEEII